MAELLNGFAPPENVYGSNPLAAGGQQTSPPYDRRPSVLDQYGKPFRSYDDFAIPSVITFASILGSSYRTFWHSRFDEAMRHSREDAILMRRDCFLMALLRERQRSVARLRWHLEAEDDKDAGQIMVRDTLTKIIRKTPYFRRFLMTQLEALWYGRYGTQFVFDWKIIDGLPALVVRRHGPINGDKIGYTYDHQPYILVHVAEAQRVGLDYAVVSEDDIADPTHAALIHTTIATAVSLRGTWRERFQIHQHEVDDADYFDAEQADSIHGVGIRSRIFWLDWLRREWLAWFSDFLERVGLGITVWEYDASNPKARVEVEKAAKEQSRRANILIPRWPGDKSGQGGSVYRVETPLQGAEALLSMKRALEDQIERYIVGQQASSRSETSGLGTHDNTMQAETKGAITELDADALAETITGSEQEPGLLYLLKKWTFPTADFEVRFKFDVQVPDPEKTLEAVKAAWEMGVSFIEPEVRGLTGLSNPKEGDDILEGQSQADAFGDDSFFGGSDQNPGEDGENPQAENAGPARPEKGSNRSPAPRFDHQRQDYAEWVTVGGHEEGGKKHVGGQPIPIGELREAETKKSARLRDGREVSFIPDRRASRHHATVWADVRKLDAAFAEDSNAYIPAGGGGAEIAGRRADFESFLDKGVPIEAPYVVLSDRRQKDRQRQVGFVDGRHRFSVLRDLGLDRIAVTIPKSDRAEFTARFGLEEEAVPFQRQRDWIAEHEEDEEAKYRRMARAFLQAKEHQQERRYQQDR